MASNTEVRNIPRGEEIHVNDPFSGNDNNRRVHQRRMKLEAEIKAANSKPAPQKSAELAAQIAADSEAAKKAAEEAAKKAAAPKAPSFPG